MAQADSELQRRGEAFYDDVFELCGRGIGAPQPVDRVHVRFARFTYAANGINLARAGDLAGPFRAGDIVNSHYRVRLANPIQQLVDQRVVFRASSAAGSQRAPGVATGAGLPPQPLIRRYRLTHRTIIDRSPQLPYPRVAVQELGPANAEPPPYAFPEVEVAHPATISIEVSYTREYRNHSEVPRGVRLRRCGIPELLPAGGTYRVPPVLAREALRRDPALETGRAPELCACCFKRVLIARHTVLSELPAAEDTAPVTRLIATRLQQFLSARPSACDGVIPNLGDLNLSTDGSPTFNDSAPVQPLIAPLAGPVVEVIAEPQIESPESVSDAGDSDAA